MSSEIGRAPAEASLPGANRRDVLIVAVLAAVAGGAAWLAASALMPAIAHRSTFDFWFESDGPAVMNQLRDRFTLDNERTNRHPLFALGMYPLVAVFRLVTDVFAAVSLASACLAAMLAALLFLLLREVGLRRGEATVFTALALVGAASMFWVPVPETFAPAAVTLVAALAALAWHERTGGLSWPGCVLVSALTLSMTVTHAVAGVLVCLLVLGLRRGSTAVVASVLLVAAGQAVERLLFPHSAAFFLPGGEIDTSAYVFNRLAGGVGNRLAGFFLHGMVLPPLQQGYTGYLSVQQAALRDVPWSVLVAWVLWALLLGVGLAGLTRRPRFAIALLGVLAAQLALVLVFGQETFLYALHSGPLLVVLAACGCLTTWRRGVMGAAVVLVLLAAAENGPRFVEARERLAARYESARAYATALSTLTEPEALIVVGLPPSEVYGWPEAPVRARPVRLALLPAFETVPLTREGWNLHYERWSPETLEQLRQAGARYFTSRYAYGMGRHTGLQAYLETHARALRRTDDWVIYALESSGPAPGSAR